MAPPVQAKLRLPVITPRATAIRRWSWVPILLLSAVAGIAYRALLGKGSYTEATVYGVVIGGSVMGFARGFILPSWHARLQRLPTWAHVPAAEMAYLLLITIGHAVAALVLWATAQIQEPLGEAIAPTWPVLVYSLAVSAALVAVMRVRDLVGTGTFVSLLTGRYHRPVEEERIFLFLDVVGSTAYAEQHGDLRAQAYLAAIFEALADPVRHNRGDIDDYVGDMAMVTWPLARGTTQARCVACVFDILHVVERDAADWRRRFGHVPRFRAALHGGAVVTAEVGVDRHKISYFGDVVNTTGRIEALCRTLGADLLISADLFDRLPGLPAGVTARPLGDHAVRGRGQRLSVLALEQSSA